MQQKEFLDYLRNLGKIAVAFSGGVDSSVLLRAAVEAVGREHTLAISVYLAAVPQRERDFLEREAHAMNVTLVAVPFAMLDDPEISRNDLLRCYYCKRQLFSVMLEASRRRGFPHLLEGSNADDLKVYRPGRKALEELGIPSPMAQFGLTKADVRRLASQWNLASAEKPSVPCLATRVAYGIPLTPQLLAHLEAAEESLHNLLSPQDNFRVRVHEGELVRLELSETDRQTFLSRPDLQQKWTETMKTLGFRFVTLDLEDFQSGRFDQ
ncbi:MAG: ATP-dependent sacrificial sulfur transferase LarE [Planctomycetia bacterium]|nr:ATP-dependent sacrificial sulfur transferase LarE [Planctomycetia bacterium]